MTYFQPVSFDRTNCVLHCRIDENVRTDFNLFLFVDIFQDLSVIFPDIFV